MSPHTAIALKESCRTSQLAVLSFVAACDTLSFLRRDPLAKEMLGEQVVFAWNSYRTDGVFCLDFLRISTEIPFVQ